jgi:hypothetical protein
LPFETPWAEGLQQFRLVVPHLLDDLLKLLVEVLLQLGVYHFFAFAFRGLPIRLTPAGMSQSCSLQLGQRLGLPRMRRTHSCWQRSQWQIIETGKPARVLGMYFA